MNRDQREWKNFFEKERDRVAGGKLYIYKERKSYSVRERERVCVCVCVRVKEGH